MYLGTDEIGMGSLLTVHETAWSNGLRMIRWDGGLMLRFQFFKWRDKSIYSHSVVRIWLRCRVVWRLELQIEYSLMPVDLRDKIWKVVTNKFNIPRHLQT